MVINIYFYSCEKQTAHTWKEKGWGSNTKKKHYKLYSKAMITFKGECDKL